MKIQKGIVKYRDRNDIVCTYGITDDGVQYYFLDETDSKKLSNGNRIVTTALVEAIDPMAKCSNIGVIDNNGSVVIACGNRSIKEINNELLLVETAQPTSLSVVEAINLKNDPLSAAKLVSTPATIKDKLSNYIGSEGKYLFNDQFSEATVCDLNGNNLLNGESFSFIVMANDKLYLSKNVPESSILEFDLAEKTVINNDMIDVSTAVVDQSVVEGALATEELAPGVDTIPSVSEGAANTEVGAPGDVSVPTDLANAVDFTVPTTDSITQDVVPNENQDIIPYDEDKTEIDLSKLSEVVGADSSSETVAVDESLPNVGEENVNDDLKAFANGAPSDASDNGFMIPDEMDMPIAADEQADITSSPVSDISEGMLPSLDSGLPVVETAEDKKDEVSIPEVAALGDEKVDSPSDTNLPVDEEVSFSDNVISHDATPINPLDVASTVDKDHNGVVDSNDYVSSHFDDFGLNSSSSFEDLKSLDNLGSSYDPLSMGHGFNDYLGFSDTNIDKMNYSYGAGSDNIMGDVVRSMSELMKQNKEQRTIINRYREQMSSIESHSRLLADKYKDQSMRMESLAGKLRSMDEINTRLESKNQLLESRLRDQEKVIASQDRELKTLRPQMESKHDLVKLLADAQSLIGSDYSYEDDTNYGKVA